jgi:hypothetical protein
MMGKGNMQALTQGEPRISVKLSPETGAAGSQQFRKSSSREVHQDHILNPERIPEDVH